MVEMYKTFERGEERHHAICDHCGKTVYPSHKNIHIFWGFKCADTGMFVSNDCKEDYYLKKNAGEYGAENAHKYSETPVCVLWENVPKIQAHYTEPERVLADRKQPLQLQLF